jgi:hypothetical protein
MQFLFGVLVRANSDADYNVYFNFPSGTETYHLGQAKGLQECGAIAHNYAASKNVSTADWG